MQKLFFHLNSIQETRMKNYSVFWRLTKHGLSNLIFTACSHNNIVLVANLCKSRELLSNPETKHNLQQADIIFFAASERIFIKNFGLRMRNFKFCDKKSRSFFFVKFFLIFFLVKNKICCFFV